MTVRQGVAILAPGDLEGALVQAIDSESERLVVVRRCADLAEVRAAAGARLARFGVVDGADPDLDAVTLEDLHDAGMAVVVLSGVAGAPDARGAGAGPGAGDARRWDGLRAIGADAVVDGRDPESVVSALLGLADGSGDPDAGTPDPGPTVSAGDGPDPPGASTPTRATRRGAPAGGRGTDDPPAGGRTVGGRAVEDDGDRGDGGGGGSLGGARGLDAAPGTVVAVWGTSGAPGRSTIALNVATVLARSGEVVLVDADTSAPSLAHMLGLPVDAPGLAALCRYAARGALGADEVRRALVPVSPGLRVLTGLALPQRWNEVSPEALLTVLEVTTQLCDRVVVDVAAGSLDPVPARARHRGGRDEVVAAVLRRAGTTLSVCRGDPVGINRLAIAHKWWQDLGVEEEPVVVVNGVSPQASGRRPGSAVAQAVGSVVPGRRVHLIPRDEEVSAALLRAGPVVDLAAGSGVSAALVELTEVVGGDPGVLPGRRRRGRRRGNRT